MTSKNKTIYIGSDHAGLKLKETIKKYLEGIGYTYEDLGNAKYQPDDDYPDYGYKVAKKVSRTNSKGVLFCGSSHGVCIVANKVKGIRAVTVHTIRDALRTREHNDANVLCLSGWNTSEDKAKNIVKVWLTTPFSNAPRHKRRVDKIRKIEQEE